jgi:uncharacterized membrane protein
VKEHPLIRYINPNYHVILIHYPIALLGVGLAIEILGYIFATGSLASAARWMVLIGALAAAPAATSGIFAKYDILQQLAGGAQGPWRDVRAAARLTGLQWHFLNLHVLCSSIGAAVAVLAAMVWLGGAARWPRPIGTPLLGLFAGAMGLMVFGAYNAGEMVYRTQLATQSQEQSDKLLSDWKDQTSAAGGTDKLKREIEFYIDSLQAHVIAAGLVFSLAAAAVGLSFQKSAQLREPLPADPQTQEPSHIAAAPAARFWFFTAAMAAAALGVGWYVMANDLPTPLWNVRAAFDSQLLQPFQQDHANGARPLVHLYLGGSILVLALLLIPAAHWAAGSRVLIGLLSLLMIAAVAAQIGMGVLMMYDTDSGPLLHFNPATPVTPTEAITQN